MKNYKYMYQYLLITLFKWGTKLPAKNKDKQLIHKMTNWTLLISIRETLIKPCLMLWYIAFVTPPDNMVVATEANWLLHRDFINDNLVISPFSIMAVLSFHHFINGNYIGLGCLFAIAKYLWEPHSCFSIYIGEWSIANH